MFRFGRVLVHRGLLPYPSANALVSCTRSDVRVQRDHIQRCMCVGCPLSARPLGRPVHMSPVVKSEKQKALVEVLVEVTERNFYNFE